MSLGSFLCTKSISSSAWRLLAPPRDTLHFRLAFSPFPTRRSQRTAYHNAQTQFSSLPQRSDLQLSHSDSRIERVPCVRYIRGESILSAKFHPQDHPTESAETCLYDRSTTEAENSTGTGSSSLQEPCEWENIVVWKDTLYMNPKTCEDLSMERCAPSDKRSVRKVLSVIRSRKDKDGKAFALLKGQSKLFREFHWYQSIDLLQSQTKIEDRAGVQLGDFQGGRIFPRGRRKQPPTQIHAKRIPRPDVWSTATFEAYVRDLSSSSVTGTLHRQLYSAGTSHTSTVVKMLHQLFEDPELYAHWSVASCNKAVSFFYKISQFSEARLILSHMEDRGLLWSARTFNIILKGSAKRKDISYFDYILKHMIEKGVKPNAGTWKVFFKFTVSDQAKSKVFLNLRDKHLLNEPAVLRKFLDLMFRNVIAKKLRNGYTATEALLEHTDRINLLPSLRTVAGNVILDEVGNRSTTRDILSCLDGLETRGMKFDEVTMNTILHHCLPDRDHDIAVEVVRHFRTRYNLLPGIVAYDALFQQAWRSHFYNCCKVIWRHACVEGLPSYRMKRRVSQSMLCDFPAKPADQSTTRADVWKAAAGKIIVGVNMTSRRKYKHLYPDLTLIGTVEGGGGCSLPATDDESPRMQNLLTELYSQDLAIAHCIHLEDTLDILLSKALAMDRQWALEDVHREKGFAWMWQQSIPVLSKEYFAARFLRSPNSSSDGKSYLEDQRPSGS